MTVNKAIAEADRLRPNLLEVGQKAGWVMEFERRLLRELGQPLEEIDHPGDGDRELFAGDGYEQIYVLWLCAQIDFAHREYDNWNNTAALLNAMVDGFKKQHLRENLPEKTRAVNVWRDEI